MSKEFLLNIVFLIAINFLVKPFYLFFIDAEVQLQVGQVEYGIFFTLFNFAFLFQVINDPGLQNYTSSKMSADDDFVRTELPSILGARLLLSLAFLAVVFLAAGMIGYPARYYPILLLVAINQILSTFFLFCRAAISASKRYRMDSMISALDKVLMIIILGYILYVDPVDEVSIYHLIYSQTAAFVIAIVVSMVLLGGIIGPLRLRIDLGRLPSLLRQTAPYALVLVLMTLYTRLDTVMLERLLDDGDYQAGVYASCYRYMEALSMIGYLFAALLLPMYARMLADKESLQSLVDTALGVLLTIILPICIVLIFYREEAILWRYPDADQSYFITLALMMVSVAAIATAYIYGTMHAASGDLRDVNIVFGVGVLVNVLFNIVLIPRYAVVGAAVATVATQMLVLLGQAILSYRSFALTLKVGYVARLVVYALAVALLSATTYYYFHWHWVIEVIVVILSAGLLSLLIKIIDSDMVLSLLKGAK
jgi:O-antigen/teichoic acid export membrane protein